MLDHLNIEKKKKIYSEATLSHLNTISYSPHTAGSLEETHPYLTTTFWVVLENEE